MNIKRHIPTIFSTILLFFVHFLPTSSQPTCHVQTFNIRDGLAANLISGLEQTNDGLIWVSTWNGLSCYDGYQFTTFRNQEGLGEALSSHRIIRIKGDSNSNLWCVTFDHFLYRFDTHRCQFYDINELIQSKYGITVYSRNIYTLDKGVTWVTANSEKGSVMRIDDNRSLDADAIELMTLDTMSTANDYVHRVTEDLDGREWILTDQCVLLYGSKLRFNGRHEYVKQIGQRVFMGSPDGKLDFWQQGQTALTPVRLPVTPTAMTCMEVLDDNTILVGTDRGLLAVTSTSSGVSVRQLNGESVKSILIDSRKRVWTVHSSQSTVHSSQSTVHSSQLTVHSSLRSKAADPSAKFTIEGLELTPNGDVHTLHRSQIAIDPSASNPLIMVEDSHQTLWAVTGTRAAYYYDVSQGIFVKGNAWDDHPQGESQQIVKYFIDSQHNLWFSSTRDLSVMRFRHHSLSFIGLEPTNEIRALATDHNGRLWAGGSNGSIMVFDTLAQRVGCLTPDGRLTPQVTPFANTKIYALKFDKAQRLWVGTRGDGLYCVDLHQGGVTHYGLNCADIYDIDEDVEGRLWIGTYGGGLNVGTRGDNGQMSFLNSTNGGPKAFDDGRFSKVRRVCHDTQGHVLVATTDGLLIMGPSGSSSPSLLHTFSHVKGDTTTLLTSDVMQTCLTRDGRLLVATMGGGMQENTSPDTYSFRRLRQFTTDEGNVLDMTEDGDGQVWVVRETTIDRYDPQTGRLQQVGLTSLADRIEFTEAEPVYDPLSGRLAIGAMGGFVFFMPRELKPNTFVPHIAFTSVRYLGQQTEQPILNSGLLHVDSDHRNLTIRFAALDYQSNELVSYAYRLDEGDWNYVGRSHEASFNHLPAGRHRLLVRSTNNDGEWLDNAAELIIEAEPTFWESWMGTLLKVLGVVCLVLGAFHIYRLRQQIQLERRMNSMKSNFYEDVSQQLREPLTHIGDMVAADSSQFTVDSSQLASLEQVQHQAQEMLAIVDEKINEYELTPPEVIDENKRIMDLLMEYLEDHIGDSDLKIEDMAEAVHLGRSVFYGKVKTMTGMAPVDFVRSLRIKRATDLLARSQYTISQIAYQVGFTDPKYFSKCFKKDTGLTPSEYREKG